MNKTLFLVLIILFTGCNSSDNEPPGLTDFIPSNSDVIIGITDLEATRTQLRNNDLSTRLLALDTYELLHEKIQQISTSDSIMIGVQTQNDSLLFTMVTRFKDSLFGETQLDSLDIHYKIVDSIFIGSNSAGLLGQLSAVSNPKLDKMLATSDGSKPFSIVFDEDSNGFGGAFLSSSNLAFSDLTMLETDISSEQILLNGITFPNDSLNRLMNVFKDNIPQVNTIQNIAPNNSDGFISFTFNDFSNLQLRLKEYRQEEPDSTDHNELLETTSEVGEIFFGSNSILALTSIDATATKEALRNYTTVINTHRTVDIIKFEESDLFNSVFDPLVVASEVDKYIVLDDFFVFANSEDMLQNVITNYQNGTTLGASTAFKTCQSNLSDASSLMVVTKSDQLNVVFNRWFDGDLSNLPIQAYNLSAFQWVQDFGYAHVNGVIRKHKSRAVKEGVTEVFNINLEADIITPPQFVTNHRTKEKEIVVQDVNNTLYLISNTGEILWKRKLIGNVLGKIEQVDLYRNGRLQLAFATPYRVYVIDRNGKNVGAFPMRFGDRITQPLSVFDYDKNRRYRFLVTQGKDLLMYDRNARFVKGFRYINPNIIGSQPKHFRIGSKDYIVFAAGKRLMILDRRGNVRVGVNDRFEFSDNEIFLYKDNFMTTTADGQLIQVDQRGKVITSDLQLRDNHLIDATAKTLVTLDENQLGIKQKTVELDFGEYTHPKIHYIYDKIYVTLTDLQTQKVHLFDSQAEPIPNFPVYGNSTIDLANADRDRDLEFVTKGESNSVVMYKKN